MPNPVQGDGLIIEVNDGAGATFVAIDVVTNITPPAHSIKKIERKRLVNPGLVEQIPAKRKDPGDATFGYEVTFTLQSRLAALEGVEKSWRVTYADGLRMAFSGWLASAKPDAVSDPDEITHGTGTITVTSLIALTDTTP